MLKKHIQPYVFALKIVWQSSKKWTILRFFLILIQSTLPLVLLYIMKLIIDMVINEGGLNNSVFDDVLIYLVYFGVTLLLQTLANTSSQLIVETQQQKVSDHMASIVQTQALKLDLSYFENPKFHNTYFQAQNESIFRPVLVATSLMTTIQNGISLLLISGFLSFMHFGVTIVLMVSIIPAIIIRYFYSKKLYQWQKDRIAKERESIYLNTVIGDYMFAKEMRVFAAGLHLRKRFKKIRKRLFKEKLKIGKLRTGKTILAKIFEVTAEVFVYAFIVHRAVNSLITVGDMVIYFQAFQKGKKNLTDALESLVKLMENKMFLSFIQDFLKFKPKLSNTQKLLPSPRIQNISFNNISFQYPEQKKWVLKNISLQLKKGELCAVVGENGSGKSTFVKLLCRLYDPKKGEIIVDGQPLTAYNVGSYQERLSITFQDFAKYQFTVEENITLDTLGNSDQNRLQDVTKSTGADEFIDTMPRTYNQVLGRQFDKGQELSLGQWQKIAISRSLYRDSDLLILDEPTSAIDPLAEHKIFETLKTISVEKIVLLVTHRIYNLKMADKIIVIDEGQIIEMGAHDELMKRQGKYFEMFQKQTS